VSPLSRSNRDEQKTRSRRFYRLRVTFLGTLLILVLVYAGVDHFRRAARREWRRPLSVALILLTRGDVDAAALELLELRVRALEERLETEFQRYGGRLRPVLFQRFGPIREVREPPIAISEPSWLEPFRFSFALRGFARESDAAAGLFSRFDGKIYVRLSEPKSERRALVEGIGENGGLIAVTTIELSLDSVDFGLFVITHELFHLLGASDRYDLEGRTLIPEGLGDPDQEPLYPQQSAEVMARGRVVSPEEEEPPGHLDQLRVGGTTASEIGWARPERAD
jgi:hypothetical protein